MNISVLMPDDDVRAMFISPEIALELGKLGNVKYNNKAMHYTTEEIAEALKNAEVCITGWGCLPLNKEALKYADNLKLVVHSGASVAAIVTEHMYNNGIRIVSGNKIYAESVAEGTLAYIFAGLRRIPFYNNLVQQGGWSASQNSGLLDKKIGLLGFGAVARYLVPMLQPFRCRISVYDPFVTDEVLARFPVIRTNSIEDIFKDNDIISLHAPQTEENYHIINEEILNLMKDGSLLVNTARGSLIDECALERVLAGKRIFAVLDVFESQPLRIDSGLRNLDNVILMPHMAGPTRDRYPLVMLSLIEDIKRFFSNQPLEHEISKEYALRMTDDTLKPKSN